MLLKLYREIHISYHILYFEGSVEKNFMQLAQNLWKEICFEHGQKCINLKPWKIELKFGTAGVYLQ